MRTNVADTSIDAYHQLIETGKESTQIKTIYEFVCKFHPCSRRQIHKATGIELGAVAGRCNALTKAGLLKEEKIGECQITGKKVKLLEPIQKQLRLV